MHVLRNRAWTVGIVGSLAMLVAAGLLWRIHCHAKRVPTIAPHQMTAPVKMAVPSPKKTKRKVAKKHPKKTAVIAAKKPGNLASPARPRPSPVVAVLAPAPTNNVVVASVPEPSTETTCIVAQPPVPLSDVRRFTLGPEGLSTRLNPDWTLRFTAKADDQPPLPLNRREQPLLPPVTWGLAVEHKF
jgi:hypothetical protein